MPARPLLNPRGDLHQDIILGGDSRMLYNAPQLGAGQLFPSLGMNIWETTNLTEEWEPGRPGMETRKIFIPSWPQS